MIMNLQLAIFNTIVDLDKNKELDDKMRMDITKSLTQFVISSTDKFIKGKIEHGHLGRLEERELDKEMYHEIIDMFFYNQAKLWKK